MIRPVFLVLIISLASCTTSGVRIIERRPNGVVVRGNGFEGIAFNHTTDLGLFAPSAQRFTPSPSEIEFIEQVLRQQLPTVNDPPIDQGYSSPIIHENLHAYKRQYVGFVTEDGGRMVYVNCLWSKQHLLNILRGYRSPAKGWKKEFILVMDGGSYFWNATIDLDTGQIVRFQVNGVA